MTSPEPDEDEQEDEAEELEEATPPGFWLFQLMRDLVGGPDEEKPK